MPYPPQPAARPRPARRTTDGRSHGRSRAGWFGIGLGLVEVFAPRALARAAGLQGREPLLRVFGARGIASGVLILAADEPKPWLWARVAGDLLDGGVLAAGLDPSNPHRGRTLLAALTVAPVVALDSLSALRSHD